MFVYLTFHFLSSYCSFLTWWIFFWKRLVCVLGSISVCSGTEGSNSVCLGATRAWGAILYARGALLCPQEQFCVPGSNSACLGGNSVCPGSIFVSPEAVLCAWGAILCARGGRGAFLCARGTVLCVREQFCVPGKDFVCLGNTPTYNQTLAG